MSLNIQLYLNNPNTSKKENLNKTGSISEDIMKQKG